MHPYISIFGKQFSSYGLLMFLAVLTVFCICTVRAKQYDYMIDNLMIVSASAIGGALFCGGLLYIFITYPLDLLIVSLRNGDFSFLQGGIVFYGGLIGGVFGAIVGGRISKSNFDSVIRIVVPYVPLGHAIGRVGCVMAGCCYGIPYDGLWALHYPQFKIGRFPVQILEAICNIVLCAVLHSYEKKQKNAWNIVFLYFLSYGVIRFFIEFLRGDEIRGITVGLSSSQWISIALVLLSIIWFFRCHISYKKRR